MRWTTRLPVSLERICKIPRYGLCAFTQGGIDVNTVREFKGQAQVKPPHSKKFTIEAASLNLVL